jgi:hypothetical protein
MYVRRQNVLVLAARLVTLSCLVCCTFSGARASEGSEFILAGATVAGTPNLRVEDLLRGLDLKAGTM